MGTKGLLNNVINNVNDKINLVLKSFSVSFNVGHGGKFHTIPTSPIQNIKDTKSVLPLANQ